MATQANKRGWFTRKSEPAQAPIRVLTAAATRLKLDDRKDVRKQRALRQGWQSDAWSYRDSIGELRYAVQFLSNCTSRMRLYPAAYPIGAKGGTQDPVALSELAGCPPEVAEAAERAMSALGDGRLAISNLLGTLSTNTTVAGECYLLGMQDPATNRETWTIRSVDEIQIKDEKYQLREVPGDPQGAIPYVDLDPTRTVISRIWTPHPRFRELADSPMRAILDDCEALLILRRMIRATGRSRLAGRGMLLIPDELTVKVPTDDNADPEADPIMLALAEAMMAPIAEEGVASAVVPIVIRGPGGALEQVQHIDFASSFDKDSGAVREELVGVIATGLDVPKEVVTGVVDLNHWTAWQVDDNTFRHHVEPHVIGCCDSLTSAYLRPACEEEGVPPEWIDRIVMWYDPTELVTHPDQTADAMSLHERLVISDETLRKTAGFGEEDAPSKAEIQVRLLTAMRAWPPNLVMAFLHQFDPTLVVPPIDTAGTIPGIAPTGVDVGTANDPKPLPAVPGTPGAVTPASDPSVPSSAPTTPTAAGLTASTSAGKVAHVDLSRKLADLDRELRVKLQTAACSAMLRHIERAGAKIRTKVAKDETMRSKIAQRPNSLVASLLGPEALAAVGVSAQDLMGGDWSSFQSQFYTWVEKAQNESIDIACRIAGASPDGPEAEKARGAMKTSRDAAWASLQQQLTDIGRDVLYDPDPNGTAGEFGDINPDTLVPTGVIRVAMAIAGGSLPAGVQ